MLFSYKTSNKKLFGIGLSVVINLILFIAFNFYITNLVGLSILFLASFVMNSVLFILQLLKGARFQFYENEIKVETKNETKTLSPLNLLFVQSFIIQRNGKERTHLVTSEGEYTFLEGEDPNYGLLKDYLAERVQASDIAKYYFHLNELKSKVPSMIASLLFLFFYIFYFKQLGFDSLFFKIILFVQGAALAIYIGQWFYYRKKIKYAQLQ